MANAFRQILLISPASLAPFTFGDLAASRNLVTSRNVIAFAFDHQATRNSPQPTRQHQSLKNAKQKAPEAEDT
jgi:hypothetical protein